MTIYHLHIDSYRRSRGRTAIGGAAYRRGLKASCPVSCRRFNFRRKEEVIFSELLPAQDDQTDYNKFDNIIRLYEAVERSEKHPRATVGREIEAALPHELALGQQVDLVREFVDEVRQRFSAERAFFDYSIHANPDNTHVHIAMSEREQLKPFEFAKAKRRDWDGEQFVRTCREIWEAKVNLALEQAGINQRVDCRSYADQGVDRIPALHEGKAAYFNSEVKNMNQEIKLVNTRLAAKQTGPNRIEYPKDDGDLTRLMSRRDYWLVFEELCDPCMVEMEGDQRAVLRFWGAARVVDYGKYIESHEASPRDSAERLIALAMAKGWAKVSFEGEDEFLRYAFSLAMRRGMEIVTKGEAQQRILEELISGHRPVEVPIPIPPESIPLESLPPQIPNLTELGERLSKAGAGQPAVRRKRLGM